MNPADLPAGTVYVPVLAGSTKPLPRRKRVYVLRCKAHRAPSCDRPWFVVATGIARTFQSFEDARLFVVALLDGKA